MDEIGKWFSDINVGEVTEGKELRIGEGMILQHY